MALSKTKCLNFLFAVILFVAFLIEGPLHIKVVVLFSFIPELGYIITSVIGYLAVFTCVILATKQNFSRYNFIKILGSVLAIAFIHRIALMISITEIAALIYQILQPAIAPIFIWLVLKSINNCEAKMDIKLLISGIIAFIINAALSVVQYISLIKVMQNMGGNFFFYLELLTGGSFFSASGIVGMIITLCRYILIFITLIFSQKCITHKDGGI